MLDFVYYFFTFFISNTFDILLWWWGGFLSLPLFLLKWIDPVVFIASANLWFVWAIWSWLYKLKKTWNFHFQKDHVLLIVVSVVWSIFWVKFALIINPMLLKKLMLISLFVMFNVWLFSGKINAKISIPNLIKKIISYIFFFFAWIYTAMIWAWWWIVFSIFYLIFTWLSLKQISSYRLITVWIICTLSWVLYFFNWKIDFNIVIAEIIAGTIWWYLGIHLMHKINEKILKILFSILVILVMIVLFFKIY